ncbi:MAG: DUF2231 domain-containing protein [Ktedonobacterales bacterium]|nr:DUF2231 domain-containing protein [Ktedonobacterales bacterium]
MLTSNALIPQLRPLIHPMLVHFPIALLFASVALDWLGYCLKHPNLTRAGFYTLLLGAFAAGIAALTGPDHVTGDAGVPALFAAHQTWAALTVALAVIMAAARFLAARGISGGLALAYLVCTLMLLGAVSLTGYYGGEMTYHHAVGVTAPSVSALSAPAAAYVRPLIPAKPFVALIGFLAVISFCLWMALGHRLTPAYYALWWRAVRQDLANTDTPLWTLQHTTPRVATTGPQVPVWQASQQPPQSPQSTHGPYETGDDRMRLRLPHN